MATEQQMSGLDGRRHHAADGHAVGDGSASPSSRIRRVFISSTVEDLEQTGHRAAARDAAVRAGLFPVMQEYWSVEDKPPLDVCLQHVSKVDVLVVVVAHRFGWVPDGQAASGACRKSITWLECEHAVAAGKEVLAFLVDPTYPWDEGLKEEYRLNIAVRESKLTAQLAMDVQWRVERLERFRRRLSERHRRTFTTPDSLGGEIESALRQWQDQTAASALRPAVTSTAAPEAAPDIDRPDTTRYLLSLHGATSRINIMGMRTGSGEAYSLPIDDIYIPLTASEPGGEDRGTSPEHAIEPRDRRVELQQALSSRRTLIVGDPGAGKSTFLDRVANLCCRKLLDGEGVDLPDGPCFPILVKIPRLLEFMAANASKHWTPGQPHTPCWLAQRCGGLATEFNQGLDTAFFHGLLTRGEAIVLLDGLDEASNAADRERIRDWLHNVSAAYEKCRFVVTTRPPGGRDVPGLADFTAIHIAPLAKPAIETFFDRWSHALYRNDTARAATAVAELRGAYGSRAEIRKLAQNAVMLTALAALHHNRRRLPEQRAELYESIIGWLASSREDSPGRVKPERCVALLQNVALAMQNHQGGRKEQVPRHEAARAIRDSWHGQSDNDAQAEAEGFLDAEEHGSGIIVKRGNNVAFWHLTFQEFLAARALAAQDEVRGALLRSDRIHQPEWREVIRLLAGVLHGHGPERVNGMFADVLSTLGDRACLEAKARSAGLLGAAARDLASMDFRPRNATYDKIMREVLGVFDADLARDIDIGVAIAAAEALGQAGDPRFADPLAPLRDASHAHWAPIPAGQFWMGAQPDEPGGRNHDPVSRGQDSSWSEGPVHRVTVDAYRIGTHPVTVGEYARFIDEVESSVGIGQPLGWEEQLSHLSRPVVGVTWDDATAYGDWATAICRQAGGTGQIRLATEAEWEYAARGASGRRFPWGDEDAEPTLLNCAGSGIVTPTPVGLYPLGATPEGVCDLAGNVWEWCQDRWRRGYVGSHGDGTAQQDREGHGQRVLRGGGWGFEAWFCRSAHRNRMMSSCRSLFIGFRVVCVC